MVDPTEISGYNGMADLCILSDDKTQAWQPVVNKHIQMHILQTIKTTEVNICQFVHFNV